MSFEDRSLHGSDGAKGEKGHLQCALCALCFPRRTCNIYRALVLSVCVRV